jgi:hypothetical protein
MVIGQDTLKVAVRRFPALGIWAVLYRQLLLR